MSTFFQAFVILCSALYGLVLLSGHFPGALGLPPSAHILLGVFTGIACVSAHCLIFAIFTGSGKDARLLVEDLGLNKEYVKRAKAFKHTVFPPALYAILWILLTTSVGGFLSGRAQWGGVVYIHLGLAWFTFYYNLKTFWMEARAVRENSRFIEELNRTAGGVAAPAAKSEELVPGAVEQYEWGVHVFALGKFLTFLGFNVWLVFLYLRVIVGLIAIPVWPFVASSLVLLAGGYFLRVRYRSFQPVRKS